MLSIPNNNRAIFETVEFLAEALYRLPDSVGNGGVGAQLEKILIKSMRSLYWQKNIIHFYIFMAYLD